MCLEVVDRAVKDEEILTQLAIPPLYWDVIAESWRARDPSLYGRMDSAARFMACAYYRFCAMSQISKRIW